MSNERTISAELQEHLDSGATTLTMLIKITPRNPEYPAFGIAMLDRDVIYDDGDGEILYAARIGMDPSAMVQSAGTDIGNAQLKHLTAPQFSAEVSEELIRAGVYDYAWYAAMIVNYEDLTMGHIEAPAGFGQVGQLTIDNRGLSFQMELTDLTKLLKQTITEVDSITCRATFGSQPIGTGGGVVEERFPCGKDLAPLWSATKTVTSVSLEPTITFTASALGAASGHYVPGMVRWITGRNAGRQQGVEDQTAGGQITLNTATMFPVEVGDTFQIREDCTRWKDGDRGCKYHFGEPEWKNHYRGEPFIPIADGDAISTPGATVGTGDA